MLFSGRKTKKELIYRCWEADFFQSPTFCPQDISGYEAGNGTEVGRKLD